MTTRKKTPQPDQDETSGATQEPAAPAGPALTEKARAPRHGESAGAERAAWHLGEERDRIADVRLEQSILFNAPLDLAPLAPSREMSAKFLAQLGAACYRRGDRAAAEAAWRTIAESDELAQLVRPWRALVLAQQGELAAALSLAPEGEHLRGEILCALGRHEEGLAVIDAAGAAKGSEDLSEWRTLRAAIWLRQAGRAREAGERIDARMEKVARFALRLRVEAMRAWLAAGEPEKVSAHHKEIARAAPGLARALRGESLSGLETLPHGLAALAQAAHARGLALYFLDRASAAELEKGLATDTTPELGVLPGPAMWPALPEGKEFVVVAESELRPSRMAYSGENRALWLAHPERPGKLYLCLSGKIPAFLWPEIGADLESIEPWLARTAERLAVDEPRVADLPQRLRLYVGAAAVPSPYSGELEEMDFHTFGRVAVSSPFLESYGWGGEHTEDPHRYFVDRGGLAGMMALRRSAGQNPQRPQMESYRTQHSRSLFTLELHRAGWVLEVRYRPEAEAETELRHARAFNARFGTRYPEDLPLDCIGLLMHFQHALTLDELKASVVAGLPPGELWRVYAVGALWHESVALDDWLRQLPPDLQQAGDEVAWIYNHLAYLLRRALARPELSAPLQTGPYPSGMAPPDQQTDEDDDEEDEDDDDGDSEEDA